MTLARSGARAIAAVFAGYALTSFSTHAVAADLVTKAPPFAQSPYSSVFWIGGDFVGNDSGGGSVGGIYALNGNINTSGWLVRGQFNYGGFDLSTGNGTYSDGAALLGYQAFGAGFVVQGYVGADYQTNHIPATGNPYGLGDRAGLMVAGRFATTGAGPYSFAADGQYTTAYNTYWVRARPGVQYGAFTVGPEVIGLGNDAFDQVRGGGFVAYNFAPNLIGQADLGYAENTRSSTGARSGNGVYGGAALVFLH